MGSLSVEARVGVFVLAAVALLAAFLLALGDFRLSSGFRLFADFAYAGNLQVGAPVKVSGVSVGRVRALSLLAPVSAPPAAAATPALGQRGTPVVRAELALDQNVKPLLTEGTKVAVGMQGIVGEAYLELAPGTPGSTPLAPDTALRGVDAPELNRLVLQVAGLVDALAGFSRTDEGAAGASLARLLSTLDGILGEHRDELGRALGDLAASAADLRGILAQTRGALGAHPLGALLGDAGATAAALRHDLPALMARAEGVVERLAALTASAERATSNGALEAVVAGAREASQNLAQISRDGRAIVARIERGEGTVGGFVNDPQIYDDVKEMLRDLKRHPWKLLWRD
jgi:phospholipid/cholesterol/gamma-HCH transport system substrate-binding protein